VARFVSPLVRDQFYKWMGHASRTQPHTKSVRLGMVNLCLVLNMLA
jgi:hypothetical protein